MAYKPLLVSPGDKHQAMYQGLLNLGQNLSASGGFSKMPTSFMSALGQGGAAFGQGYQSEIDRAKEGQVQNLQYQQAQAQMQKTQMDIDAAKKQQAQNAQARMRAEQYYASLKGTPSGAVNEEGTDAGDYGVGAYVGGASTATPQPPSEFLTPLEEAAFNVDPVAAMKARMDAKIASNAANLKLEQQIRLKQTPGAPGTTTSLPGTAIQYAGELRDARKALDDAIASGKPESIAAANQYLSDLNYTIAKDPNAIRSQASAKGSGAVTGKAEGESQTRLKEAMATYPKLQGVVKNLKELGSKASYRWSDRVQDEASIQLGGEASEGAIARATYIATVKNNVLPLLRQTFGAAFTAAEGESLLSTLGDPNMHPAVKNSVLDAFIKQKYEDIKSMKRQSGQSENDNLRSKYGLEQ